MQRKFKAEKKKLEKQKGTMTGALAFSVVNDGLQLVKVSVRQMRQKLRNRLWRAKRRYRIAEQKAKHIVKDLHYKIAHHLLRRYQTIILPHTSSHHWRKGKKLGGQTKKRAMTLAFGKFTFRLKETSTFYPGSIIKRGSEAYTSKQCGKCGQLNETLGGSKVFRCNSCQATADRDIHAARNILLRFMVD